MLHVGVFCDFMSESHRRTTWRRVMIDQDKFKNYNEPQLMIAYTVLYTLHQSSEKNLGEIIAHYMSVFV